MLLHTVMITMIMEIVYQKQHCTCARTNSASSHKTAVVTVIFLGTLSVVYNGNMGQVTIAFGGNLLYDRVCFSVLGQAV